MSDSMYDWLHEFPAQVQHSAELGASWDLSILDPPESVVFLGIGGSAIGATLVCDLLRDQFKCPVTVIRGDMLPTWLGKRSLAVAVSYSGETRETLDAYRQALDAGAQAASISSGGTLAELSAKHGVPHLLIPADMAPRAAISYTSLPLINLLQKTGTVSDQDLDIDSLTKHLKRLRVDWSSATGPGIGIAQRLLRHLPLVLGGGLSAGVARRFQAQLAENAKAISICFEVPEALHNLVETLDSFNLEALQPVVVSLEDPSAVESLRLLFPKVREFLLKTGFEVIPMLAEGDSPITRLFSLIHKVDWISYHLAKIKGVDPVAIPIISALKETLSS